MYRGVIEKYKRTNEFVSIKDKILMVFKRLLFLFVVVVYVVLQ